jgi:hypothetical protein
MIFTRILTQDLESKTSTPNLRKPQKTNTNATSAPRPLPKREGVSSRNFFHAGTFLSKVRGLRNLSCLRFFLSVLVKNSGETCPLNGELG